MKEITIDDVVKALDDSASVNEIVEIMEKIKKPIWICQGCGAKDSINEFGRCRIVTCYHQNFMGG